MTDIKFGTDGWRAIIAKDYTVANLARVSHATAQWLLQKKEHATMVLGYDCRFGGELFAETTARVVCSYGIKVFMSEGFVSTPMVSLGTKQLNADAGIIITASHNPPAYNGYKIKAGFGGPASPASIQEVEDLISNNTTVPETTLDALKEQGLLEIVDLEGLYIKHVEEHFDLDTIRNFNVRLAYDAMYGAGQNVVKKLLPDAVLLHADYNPSFMGQAPEPIARNLGELSALLASSDDLGMGLATDGDADRIGLFDGDGNFVDAHHVILLLIHYLHKYKGMTGKVVVAFSVSDKVKALCDHYGLEYEVTRIGFKYIAEVMVTDDVLVGGEESGGIAVKGHIPERDGIWDGLMILEFMAKTGKSLQALIQEIYDIVGPFSYNRNDLHISEELKQEIIKRCQNGEYQAFGDYAVEDVRTIDGFKYNLGNERYVMIRPSGTEPVLRVYGEAPNAEDVEKVLKAAKQTLLG